MEDSIQPITHRSFKKQYLSVGVLAVLFVGVLFAVQFSQQKQETRQRADLTLNGYYQIFNHEGKALAILNTSTADSAHVDQWGSTTSHDQDWSFVPIGNGYYKIVNRNSGKLLAVGSSSTAEDAQVVQYHDLDISDQHWQLVGVGGGYYKIVNQNSGKVLTYSGSNVDGANIVQETYSGAYKQKYYLVARSSTALAGNLAYQKTVSVSSTGDSLPASRAVDGNDGTRWSSAHSVDPQWFQIDLGSTQTINKVILKWELAYATAYQIQMSSDASHWTTIYSTSSGNGTTDTLNVSGTGRYIRMYGTARSISGAGYSLWEFEVYGASPTAVPTAVPTSVPAATNTPVPTVAPTNAPTPTPIQAQATATPVATQIPQPTSTPVPGSTALNITLGLHGIGTGGDSVNANGIGNTSPARSQRTIIVEVYDVQNQLVLSKQGTVLYNSATGKFNGTVDLGTQFVSGVYTVKIKADQYLRGLVSGIQTITQGQTINLPTLILVAGDVNGDNQVNIVDYNLLIGCYSDLLPAVDCTPTNKVLTDINDDGGVNQYDYNLFLRELTNVGGQ